jgi:hypothetical protein
LSSYFSEGNSLIACRLCSHDKRERPLSDNFTCHKPQQLHQHLEVCIKNAKKKPAHKHGESLVRYELLCTSYLDSARKCRKRALEVAAAACPKAAQSQAMMKAMMTTKTTTRIDLLKLAAKLIITEKLAFNFAQSEFFSAYTSSLQKFARSNSGMDFTLPAKDKMKGIIVEVCEESVNVFLDYTTLRKDAMRLGCGLLVDGRTDAGGRGCEVGVLSAGGYSILIATLELLHGKNAISMQAAWRQFLSIASTDFPDRVPPVMHHLMHLTDPVPNVGLGNRVYYIVSDSASASAVARRTMELICGLLSLPCMAHLVALIPKHLVSKKHGVRWIISIIESFESITHVFRTWYIPKMLLKEQGGKMQRLINTRFMYIFGAIQVFICFSRLAMVINIFNSEAFKLWELGRSIADKKIIDKAKIAAFNPLFPVGLAFIIDLFSPWMHAMRYSNPPFSGILSGILIPHSQGIRSSS